MKPFTAIAAVSRNGVIGDHGRIPWHLPEDFRFFKRTTVGHVLVMGRKTFESIGRPLPGRHTIVLSRSLPPQEGIEVVRSLDDVGTDDTDPRILFLCGGGEVYALGLPRCREVILTHVHRDAEGDARFPDITADFRAAETLLETDDFRVVRYVRRPA